MFKEVLNEFFGDILKLMNRSQVQRDLVIALGFVIVGAFFPSTFLYVPTQTEFLSLFTIDFHWFAFKLIAYLLLLILFVSKTLYENPLLVRKVLIYLGAVALIYMAYLLNSWAQELIPSELQSCIFVDKDFFANFLGLSKADLASAKKYCAALTNQRLTYSIGLGGILYLVGLAKVIQAGQRIKANNQE